MANTSAKQQIVQSIKDVTNILVTVSKDPSVDELSAALGLTIFLNALGKHATAVFSGKVPPAITFLEPDKTFEETADSLRDFIIALDKEKADHLRYKVVDDAVDIVMEHAIEYLSANRDIAKTDVGRMLERLRGAYTSSRSTDKRLMDARSQVENVVRQATGSKNENAVASVRTAWMLYLVARAYTMRYYSSR